MLKRLLILSIAALMLAIGFVSAGPAQAQATVCDDVFEFDGIVSGTPQTISLLPNQTACYQFSIDTSRVALQFFTELSRGEINLFLAPGAVDQFEDIHQITLEPITAEAGEVTHAVNNIRPNNYTIGLRGGNEPSGLNIRGTINADNLVDLSTDRVRYPLAIQCPGTLTATTTWAGDQGLSLILNNTVQTGFIERVNGDSPLTLTYDVTQADVDAGVNWRLSLVNFASGTPRNVITEITFPRPDCPGAQDPGGPDDSGTGGYAQFRSEQLGDRTFIEDFIPQGGQKVYNFVVEAGDSITVSLVSEEFDTYLEIIDPDGAIVVEDDDSGGNFDSRIADYTFAESGPHQILVRSYANAEGGNYDLRIQYNTASSGTTNNNNNTNNANSGEDPCRIGEPGSPFYQESIAGRGTIQASIPGNGTLAYCFDGTAGEVISATLNKAGLNTTLQLVGGSGVLERADSFANEASVSISNYSLPADDLYYVFIFNNDNNRGTVELEFTRSGGSSSGNNSGRQPNNDPGPVNVGLPPTNGVTGTLNTGEGTRIETVVGESRDYAIIIDSNNQTEQVTITLEGYGDNDPVMELIRDGQVIASNDDHNSIIPGLDPSDAAFVDVTVQLNDILRVSNQSVDSFNFVTVTRLDAPDPAPLTILLALETGSSGTADELIFRVGGPNLSQEFSIFGIAGNSLEVYRFDVTAIPEATACDVTGWTLEKTTGPDGVDDPYVLESIEFYMAGNLMSFRRNITANTPQITVNTTPPNSGFSNTQMYLNLCG
jgi:hypothetical protein